MSESSEAYEYADKMRMALKTAKTKKNNLDMQIAVMQNARDNYQQKEESRQRDLDETMALINQVEAFGTEEDREELRASIMQKYDLGMKPERDEAFQAEVDKILEWDKLVNALDGEVRKIYYRKK